MRIAVTGGTGFLGRYLLREFIENGHACRAWLRAESDRTGLDEITGVEWIEGDLGNRTSLRPLLEGTEACVHAALFRPGAGFRGAEGDLLEFAERNLLGTLGLISAARDAGVRRFIFISTCAVHERILNDRPLDETHPLWPSSHYGAHKAALEMFVHSFGLGEGYDICSLRPTGIYGLAHRPEASKWWDLVGAVARGERVETTRGGKEVHAVDVARATSLLLDAPSDVIRGQAFNCYDRYISQYDVATLSRKLSGSRAEIVGEPLRPRHQIETGKLRALGMRFGGDDLLRETIAKLINISSLGPQ